MRRSLRSNYRYFYANSLIFLWCKTFPHTLTREDIIKVVVQFSASSKVFYRSGNAVHLLHGLKGLAVFIIYTSALRVANSKTSEASSLQQCLKMSRQSSSVLIHILCPFCVLRRKWCFRKKTTSNPKSTLRPKTMILSFNLTICIERQNLSSIDV